MTPCEIVAFAIAYATLVILCGVATVRMVIDELKQFEDQDRDE